MTLNYKIIGKGIKQARKRKKFSQEVLAEIIDKSSSYISYIETGKKHLSLETLVDIANALEVSADELLSYNIEHRNEIKSEFTVILEKCTTYERKVITDVAKALKQSLQEERRQRRYD